MGPQNLKGGRPRAKHRTLLSALMWSNGYTDESLAARINSALRHLEASERSIRNSHPSEARATVSARTVEKWRLGETRPKDHRIITALGALFDRCTGDAQYLFEAPAEGNRLPAVLMVSIDYETSELWDQPSVLPLDGELLKHPTLLSLIMQLTGYTDQVWASKMRVSVRSVEKCRLGVERPHDLRILRGLNAFFGHLVDNVNHLFERPTEERVREVGRRLDNFDRARYDSSFEDGGDLYSEWELSNEDAAVSMDLYPDEEG